MIDGNSTYKDNQGIMICGHGSRDKDAVLQFANLADLISNRLAPVKVAYGYLEFARPIIRQGLDDLVQQGVTDILAVPAMLFAAGHAKNDIPSVLNQYAANKKADIKIRYGRELGIDNKMIRAAAHRIKSITDSIVDFKANETLLVVIGRGSSDPDANSNVNKITRMLWEGLGYGWGETGYSGVTFPLVEPCLEHCAKLGFKRIVVFPYFLFTGILIKRIYDYTDKVAERYPHIDFIKIPYLSDHPLVIDTLVERIQEIEAGDNKMNCQLCKYREQVLGFEAEVGLAQESHHHHVEGIETGHEHSHHHSNSHEHSHHHPYPHADHPLGPKSMKTSKK